jgi:hypothetical protein
MVNPRADRVTPHLPSIVGLQHLRYHLDIGHPLGPMSTSADAFVEPHVVHQLLRMPVNRSCGIRSAGVAYENLMIPLCFVACGERTTISCVNIEAMLTLVFPKCGCVFLQIIWRAALKYLGQ